MNKYTGWLVILLCCLSFFSYSAFSNEVSVVDDFLDESVGEVLGRDGDQEKYIPLDSSTNEYQLGSGDKIKIHVFGQPDMDVEVRLGASGDVRYPFLGEIHVIGMTLPGLERKIAGDLSNGYLVNPQVRVTIEEYRPFYVNGEVNNPGAYPYQPELTVRKAISLAGGFTVDADRNKIFLIHSAYATGEGVHASLGERMIPGDTLTIEKSFFFVNGEVKSPGKYSYQPGITYRMAISMAGGLKDKSNEDKVYVIHEGRGKKTIHVKDLNGEVLPGDVITSKEGFF